MHFWQNKHKYMSDKSSSGQHYKSLLIMNSKKIKFETKGIERPPKLSEQIETQLNDAIHKQVFGQGELLPSENELANIFGVSRNVIRESLSILSAKG